MPSEKTILTSFAHGDLQAAVSRLQVTVTDRRRKDALVAGLLKDRATPFATLLNGFAAPALKLACEALDITPEGRGKAAYVAALAAAVPDKKSKAKPAAKAAAKPKAKAKEAPAPSQAAKPKAGKAAPAAKAGPKKTAVVPAANKKAHRIAQELPTPAAKARAQVAKAAKAVKAVKEAKATGSKSAAPAAPAAKGKAAQAAPELVAEVLKQDGAAPAAAQPAPAAEPAKKAVRRGPLSWSEAAQMAAHRGQSAATMLRAPVPQSTGTVEHTCAKCHKSVTLQACQVQACNNYYVAAPGRKICSECLFERNTISMDDFNDRLHEERQCTHCGVPMTHLSGGNA